MIEKNSFYIDNHEKHVTLIDEILSRAEQLFFGDKRAACVTYEQIRNAEARAASITKNIGTLAVRSAVYALNGLHDALGKQKTGPIVPEKSTHSILLKEHKKRRQHVGYTFTGLETTRGGFNRMLTIGIGKNDIHRVRAVLLTSDGRYSSIQEKHQTNVEEFEARADILINGGIRSLLEAIKNGRPLNGYSLPRSFNFIRSSLEISHPDFDIDGLMRNLTNRYIDSALKTNHRNFVKYAKNELSIDELQDLCRFIDGDS